MAYLLTYVNLLFVPFLFPLYGGVYPFSNEIAKYKVHRPSVLFHLKSPNSWFDSDTLDEEGNSSREDEDFAESSRPEDWRSFRAQLVSMEQLTSSQSQVENQMNSQSKTDPSNIRKKRKSWAFESGCVLEQGTVILHRPPDPSLDFGYCLGRQYFHKAVILILEVDDEYDHGIVTKGCILNRPTNLILDDFNGTHSFQWKVFFGGDEFGLHTDQPKFYCLHSLNFYEALEVSRPVIEDIYFTSIQNAKELVYSGLATPDDFWTFSGFISWEPNELRQDVIDRVWYAISTDSYTLQKGLRILSAGRGIDPQEAGIRTWSMLMDRIGKNDEVDDECFIESSYCDFTFDDLMLREWARENLIFEHPPGPLQDDHHKDSFVSDSKTNKHPLVLVPGTILRGSSAQRSPFLLSNQEFHKSIILIVQDNDELTVGVILNQPTLKSIPINTKSSTSVPLRFGGHVGGPSSSDEENMSPTSLIMHMSQNLQKMGIGSPLGGVSGPNGVWICTKDEVIAAIVSGYALPSDFIFTDGCCIWPKAIDQSSCGIGEELAAGRFEIVHENMGAMWNILLKQRILSPSTLDENLDLISKAWGVVGRADSSTNSDNLELLHKTRIAVSTLSYAALKTWILAFLLNDPTSRP